MKKHLRGIWVGIFFLSIVSTGFAKELKIDLVTEPAWFPFYGIEMEEGGIITDLAREALKKVGYRLQMDWVPWKRAVEGASDGIYGGLLGCYYTKERAEKLEYSLPIMETKVVFFQHAERKPITFKTLKDLKDYSIGTSRGYVYTDEFDSANYLHKQEVVDINMNIRKLLGKRFDLLIASREVVFFILNRDFPKTKHLISMVKPELKVRNIHIGFSKKRSEYKTIVKKFNRGLEMIKKDGTYGRILKKHGFVN